MPNRKPLVLVAQDEQKIFDLLIMMTEFVEMPCDFELAKDGQVAVDRIKEGKVYDAILMNINMPRMDGITATEEIRKLGYKKPIIAWSGYLKEDKWPACKQAGMNGYIRLGGASMLETIIEELTLCNVLQG